MVCCSELSPSGSVPLTVPSSAEWVPPWALAVLMTGVATPLVTHGLEPDSKPPLYTSDADADGVTAADGSETGPLPLGLLAVTVNVYVVPLASPVTTVAVGAGVPLTVVWVCATPFT